MSRERKPVALVAAETAQEQDEDFDETLGADLPDENAAKFRTPGFARMRLDWRSDDRPVIERAETLAEDRLVDEFADAYQVLYAIYDAVRTPERDPETGFPLRDRHGFTVWHQGPDGSYEEDFSRLTQRDKEHFLWTIITRLVDWEQRVANAWGHAMFAKGQWTERFAIAFDDAGGGTIDARQAVANRDAAEERYFALQLSYYSKKAEALVRSLCRIEQRIKDMMQI